MIGLGMMLTGVLGVLVQVFAIGPVVARIGERGALLLGCIGGAAGFLLYGFAPTGWAYLASAPIFSLIGFIQPGLQGLMTRKVGPHEQGQLQGANQGLQGISSVVGPAMFGGIFAWSVRSDASLHMPGLAIYVAALLLLAALALGWKVARVPATIEA
jgi:DHA1 family tetracycline resistance protein-like MFS transporter